MAFSGTSHLLATLMLSSLLSSTASVFFNDDNFLVVFFSFLDPDVFLDVVDSFLHVVDDFLGEADGVVEVFFEVA